MENRRTKSWLNDRWLLVIGATLVAMAAFACSSDKTPDDGNDSGGSQPTATVQSDLADEQVLRLRISSEPPTLDPHLGSFAVESTITKQLFSGLFTYDEDLNVVPGLAKEMPTVENGGISEDGLTYTIKLADDAKWSDGQPLTASDFVYSLKRALDPSLAAPYAPYFYGVDGAMAYNTALGSPGQPLTPSDAELAQLRDGVGVSAMDDQTIVYHLAQPSPSFLNYLALEVSYPVRQDVVEQYGAQWTEAANYVGDGPFVLAEWQHNQRLVLEPNQYWHGEQPTLSRIEINIIADDAAAYAAYLADELDIVSVPPSSLQEVKSPGSSLSDQLIEIPELGTFAVFMNEAMTPFDDQNVRLAFARAIDRDALVEGLLQGSGLATTTWIAPGMPGYNPNLGVGLAFDAKAAQDALAAAGYPNGEGFPEVTFLSVDQPLARVLGQFIEAQFKENLNIEVKHEYVDGPTYGARFTGNQAQATVVRWGANWPYPDNWLPSQFSSQSPNNHLGYANPAFDQLVGQAAAETDDATRLDLYDQAQALLLQDVAISPLFNLVNPVVVKPWVKGLVPTGLDGEITGDNSLANVSIAAH